MVILASAGLICVPPANWGWVGGFRLCRVWEGED